ncbi:hypothetical protein, partial [Sphingomonas sp. ABOLH]|uniref:hypothetical protein n=1 Tax=Sphingomonas sp. ABOLH TaxID=1985881 RepID=UPI0019D06DD0
MSAVGRARSVIGCRFRRQGRTPDDGFDCVGLVGWAHCVAVPDDCPPRCSDVARVVAGLGQGFRQVEQAVAGDVLLIESGPGQLHLAIASGDGVIHADAVARAVVERPGPPPWPVLSIWRKREDEHGDDGADDAGRRSCLVYT